MVGISGVIALLPNWSSEYEFLELLLSYFISKFKLISLNWKEKIYALGGINYNTKQKLMLTKVNGFGFSSLKELSPK